MELTFVHQYSGDTPKRRRLAKACDSCRTRKKRCVHFADGDDKDGEDAGDQDSDTRVDSAHGHTPTNSSASRKRFLSDLNPEALFLGPTTSRSRDKNRPNEDLGIWIDRREYDTLVRQSNKVNASEAAANVQDQRPHSSVLTPLIDIYFRKIHPILPLLDEDQFRREYTNGIIPEPMAHALCLVAAKDAEAAPHLRLVGSTTTLPPREFASRMHASVMGALKTSCRFDKIALIRILALASMHSEGFEGAEGASLCISQAMHHAQTLGIHLANVSGNLDEHETSMKRLFWCLWTLDRYNSAIHGRPIVMADRDIAQERFAHGESGFPAFDAWVQIATILDKVIDFYRPHNPIDSTGWETNFPDFESIFDGIEGGWNLPQSIMSTLHMHFLMVAILSHRTRGIKQVNRGGNSSIRQRLCANEVVRFMESDHAKDVHQLPAIPYMVSLSLAVAYQTLRQSQILHQQEDARRELRACAKILQQLRRTWCSVDTTTALARKVLDEVDKSNDLAVFRVPRIGHAHGNGVLENAIIPPPSVCPDLDRVRGAEQAAHGSATGKNDAVVDSTLDGLGLFDGMDDVFGAYLDPNNNQIQLDDMPFIDDLTPWDWNEAVSAVR